MICRSCGDEFERLPRTNRLHCTTCRPGQSRSVSRVNPDDDDGPEEHIPGPLELRSLAELERVGRVDTIAGQLVLHVARQIEAGGHTGSQTAALASRLLEASREALAGTPPPADAADELARRRYRNMTGT